nr:MAG TPA: hypothetical protein [Caudoviricetes sp.]
MRVPLFFSSITQLLPYNHCCRRYSFFSVCL